MMYSHSPINPAIPRCPECRAKDVIKKGTRKTRYEARQRWGCNRCGHTFTNLVTKYSPYPVKVIMEGIGRYNLGYSARATVRYLTRRFRINVPEKTFRLWYTAHKPIYTHHTIASILWRHKVSTSRTTAYVWSKWVLLSAVLAALSAIIAKIGLEGVDSDFATLIRTCVIMIT
jgi:hypothetical protein